MSKLKEFFRRFSICSLPLFFAAMVFLDFALRFFYRFLGHTALFAWKPMMFTLSWALLVTALVSLLPALGRRIAMAVLGLFFGVLLVTHGVIYCEFGHLFSFSDARFAETGAKFVSWAYFTPVRKGVYLCLAVYLLMVLLAILLVQKPVRRQGRWKWKAAGAALAGLSLIPLFCLHGAMLPPKEDEMWWGSKFDPNDPTQLYRTFTDPNQCMMLTGLYQYTFRDFLVSFGFGEDRRSVERLDEYFREREISGENEMTGSLAGKNLIMVMMESIDSWLITPEYMPNLYALKQESMDLENFYTPLYLTAATFTTEIVSQTGMIPPVSGFSNAAYSTNAFPLSLANSFEEAGYTANSFHSASREIYSRGTIHPNLGFEEFRNHDDLNMEDYRLDTQLLRGYDQMVSDEPFFTYIITYSGHGPYTEELDGIAAPHYEQAAAIAADSGVDASPENMEEFTRAIAHAMETDDFIGGLVERLREEGRLEDTVLLFYADHYGKYLSDKAFLKQLKGVSPEQPQEIYRTPCFLYGAGIPAQKVEKLCQSADLAPTLVNLFGLSTDRRYYAGDDIFGDLGGVVMFPHYGWYDGSTYYSGSYAGPLTDEIEAQTAAVAERMEASMDAMKSDYFKRYKP